MVSTSYVPEDLPLDRTADELLDTFDLFADVQNRLAPGFSAPHLANLQIFTQGHDGFFQDHHDGGVRQNRYVRMLRLMRPGESFFGTPIWALIFKYLAVHPEEAHWDIKANFTYEDRHDNVSRDFKRKAKYRLSEIIISEDEGHEGRLETDLHNTEKELRRVDAIFDSLSAWAASGYGMQVRCRRWNCQSDLEKTRVFTPSQIDRFSKTHLNPEALRARLRCSNCGENNADLLLHKM